MEFFTLLTLATIVIAVLAVVSYRRTRDIGLLIGSAALYYWSLYGAWYIVIDKSGGFSGKNYHYLEAKLFPIELDSNYLLTLALYAGFIVTIQLTLLASLERRRARPMPRLVLRHEPILAIGAAAAIGSVCLIADKLSAAWTMNVPAYWYTRTQLDEWFTLHQVLNRVALIPPAIGLAAMAAGRESRCFVSATRPWTLPAYLALLGGMAAFTFVLGNKNEVLVALLAGFLAYLGSQRRPRLAKASVVMLGGLWFLYSIDFFRSVPFTQLGEALSQRLNQATEVGRFVASSNEAYGAHFSLYGVLATGTEPRFGYSLYALACSVMPRVMWPDRPQDIYFYYSESVGAVQNQGYSIHHATGWYLSFGYLGVALGAVALGLVWAYCANARGRIRRDSGLLFRLFATLAPWLFVAYLAPLVRAGPEGYKGFAIEGVLVPLATFFFACRRPKARRIAWMPAPEQRTWNYLLSR